MLGESANEPYNPHKYNLYGHARDMGGAPAPQHTHDGPDRVDMPAPTSENSPANQPPRPAPSAAQQAPLGSDPRIPLPPPVSRDPPQSGGNNGPPEAVRMGGWIIPSTPIMTGNGATRQLADTSSPRFSKSQAAVQDAPCEGAYYGNYDDTLYQTQWEAQQEVVSTGAIINPYTGEVSETFENAIPPPDRRGGDQAREMKQKQLRLEWANGGQTHKHEKQDLEQPLPSADSGPISEAQSYQQLQNVAIESLHRQERSTWHNRNDELLQDTQMTRNPYGFRGQQNMVRIHPFLSTTNQLDNGGYMPMQEVTGTNKTVKPSTRLHKEAIYGDGRFGLASADELTQNVPGAVRKSNTSRHVEQSDFTANPSRHALAGGAPSAIVSEQNVSNKNSQMIDGMLHSAIPQAYTAPQAVASASSVLSTLGLQPTIEHHTYENSSVIGAQPIATIAVDGPAHANSRDILYAAPNNAPLGNSMAALGTMTNGVTQSTMKTVPELAQSNHAPLGDGMAALGTMTNGVTQSTMKTAPEQLARGGEHGGLLPGMVGAACATASSESIRQTLISDTTPGNAQTNVMSATLVGGSDATRRQNLYGDAHVITEHQGTNAQLVAATMQHSNNPSGRIESTLMHEEMLQGSAPSDYTAYPALAALMSQSSQKKSVLTQSLNSFVGSEYAEGRPTFGVSEAENASKRTNPSFPTLLTGNSRIQAGQSRIQQSQYSRQMTIVDGALHALPTISENAPYTPVQEITASTKADLNLNAQEHALDMQVCAPQALGTAESQVRKNGSHEYAAGTNRAVDMENMSSTVSSQQQELNSRKETTNTRPNDTHNITSSSQGHATYGASQANIKPETTPSAAYDTIATVHGQEIGQGTQRTATAPPIFKEDKQTQYTGNVAHPTRQGQAPAGQGTVNETRGGVKIERLGYEKIGNDSLGFRQAERPEVARVPDNLNAAPRVVRDELLSTRNPSGHWERRGRERHREPLYGGGGGEGEPTVGTRTRRSLRQYALRSGVPRQVHAELESNSESEYSEY